MKDIYFVSGLGLPQGTEKQDSEQFFRKVLGPSDGSALSGIIQTNMRPVLEGESNRSGLPLRNLPGKIKPNAHLVVCTCESSLTLIGYIFFFFLITGASTSGSLPSASMMEPFPGLSQSPFFDSL